MSKGVLDAESFTVGALSGTSPAKHFVLPSTKRQTSTTYSDLSLQTMTQEILRAHRTPQTIFDSKQWSCLQLPTYSQVSQYPTSRGVSYTSFPHTETCSNNLTG